MKSLLLATLLFAAPAFAATWKCNPGPEIIGQFIVSFSETGAPATFAYQASLSPGSQAAITDLSNTAVKETSDAVRFNSDQVDLVITLGSPDPYVGYSARVQKFQIESIGPNTSGELVSARWFCKSN